MFSRRALSRLASFSLALLLLPISLSPTAPAASEPQKIEGPGGPGFITLLVEPVDTRVIVEMVVQAGPKSVYGSAHFDPQNHDLYLIGAPGRDEGDTYVEILSPTGHEYRHHFTMRNDTMETGGAWNSGARTGIVFFAAGAITDFDVYIHKGIVQGVGMGPDAVAAWGDDFEPSNLRASVRTPITRGGVHHNETSTFEFPRPFVGEFRFDLTSSITLTSPSGSRSCPCQLEPSDTEAGHHTVTIDGAGYDGLIYWAAAPTFPEVQSA